MKSKIALNIMVSVKGQYGLGPLAWLDMDLDEEQDSSKRKRPIWDGPVAWLDMDLDEEQDSSKHNGKCKRPI